MEAIVYSKNAKSVTATQLKFTSKFEMVDK